MGKATEHLLGEGIQPQHLNDARRRRTFGERLGRVLDQLFQAGVTPRENLVKVALLAASRFGVNWDSLHLDSSSFHVHGAYLTQESSVAEEPPAINITHGYSRDHRPDLKQFIVDLICSGDSEVPLYLRVADGNESDQAIFAQLMRNFRQQWQCDALFVADAALYTEDNLQSLNNMRWLSRVPATIKAAQELMEQLPDEAFRLAQLKGYRWACVCSTYGGLKQRWLVGAEYILPLQSAARKEADLKHLEQKIQQHFDKAQKQLAQLCQQDYACAPDALAAAEQWNKKWRYHHLSQIEVVAYPYYSKPV